MEEVHAIHTPAPGGGMPEEEVKAALAKAFKAHQKLGYCAAFVDVSSFLLVAKAKAEEKGDEDDFQNGYLSAINDIAAFLLTPRPDDQN